MLNKNAVILYNATRVIAATATGAVAFAVTYNLLAPKKCNKATIQINVNDLDDEEIAPEPGAINL